MTGLYLRGGAMGAVWRRGGVTVAVGDGSRTIVVVVDGDVEVATVELDGSPTPDLAVVAAVARLRLVAGRMGWSIRLENPCGQLRDLLEFVGLGDLLLDPAPGTGPARGRYGYLGSEPDEVDDLLDPGGPA